MSLLNPCLYEMERGVALLSHLSSILGPYLIFYSCVCYLSGEI
ncbi:hypothetical protein SAMN04515695_1344 [Pseudovibrio sp. Tun.PSC04-5.I4]|nr:hypothetical protein SAMN04515695_1344 [Pseudovibrio sp. Tun.PSC04-5.I4]